MAPKTSIEAFTGASLRDDVKCAEAKSLASDVSVARQSITLEQ